MRDTPTDAQLRYQPDQPPTSGQTSDCYRDQWPEEDRQVYEHASDGPDLRAEIRLVRALIAILARNPLLYHVAIAKSIATLCRVIALHLKSYGTSSDWADLIAEASEKVIEHHGAALSIHREEES